jgi:poly(A) polymerase
MTDIRIEPQPWMEAPETRAVLDALGAGAAAVRFVGGCVRDAVAGRAISDIDLATDAPPERVVELLEAAGLKAVPTGIDHGTVTAVSAGRPYEVTTLRHDVETDGRHAVVAFTDDWEADAARRDFTMNALSLESDGLLHDPFGGVADLRAGRVRFVGDPNRRIGEDVLRCCGSSGSMPITDRRRRTRTRLPPAARWHTCYRGCRPSGCGWSSSNCWRRPTRLRSCG